MPKDKEQGFRWVNRLLSEKAKEKAFNPFELDKEGFDAYQTLSNLQKKESRNNRTARQNKAIDFVSNVLFDNEIKLFKSGKTFLKPDAPKLIQPEYRLSLCNPVNQKSSYFRLVSFICICSDACHNIYQSIDWRSVS